jgi:hypothetical protein
MARVHYNKVWLYIASYSRLLHETTIFSDVKYYNYQNIVDSILSQDMHLTVSKQGDTRSTIN